MSDKRTIGEKAGNKKVFCKNKLMGVKIHENPKYKDIKSSLNTGMTKNHVEIISKKI